MPNSESVILNHVLNLFQYWFRISSGQAFSASKKINRFKTLNQVQVGTTRLRDDNQRVFQQADDI
jgi:hypothetical protein